MKMKLNHPTVTFVWSALLLGLIPAAGALPQWLQPHAHGARADAFAPRDYTVYERAESNSEHYTHYGYGPQPTISTLSSGSAASTDSGEETSSSGTEISQSSIICQSMTMLIIFSFYYTYCACILCHGSSVHRYCSHQPLYCPRIWRGFIRCILFHDHCFSFGSRRIYNICLHL
jgi:hypothetical protein